MFGNISPRRKIIVVFGVFVGIFIFIGVVVLILSYANKSQYGNGVVIQNYDQLVKNLPKERKDSITTALYNIIQKNLGANKTIPTIDDAIIRKGSEQQQSGDVAGQYSGSFIVDINSIKQSYKISYAYSPNPDDGYMAGYPTLATCLNKSELIYPDFACKDIISTETQGIDPIIQYLPYSTLSFEIRAIQDTTGNVSLKITLYISEVDKKTGIDKAIATYKQQALDWIQSRGFDPSKYTITYVY